MTSNVANSTFYPVFVDSAGTNKQFYQNNDLTYNPFSELLTTSYIQALIGYFGDIQGVPQAIGTFMNSTLADNTFANIQIGTTNTTNKSWFIRARENTIAANTILSLAPYGASQTGTWYVDITGNTYQGGSATASSFIGPATQILTTNNNTATLCYPTFVATAGNSSLFVDNTTGPLTYTPSTATLTTSVYTSPQTVKTNTVNAATKRTQCFVRTSYPTTVGTAGDMFTVSVAAVTSSYIIEIEMVNSTTSNSKARKFIVPCVFGNTGATTNWRKVLPFSASTDSANEIELQTASVNNLQAFRIVRRAGATTPDVQLWVTTAASLGAAVYGDTTAIATSVDTTVYAIVRSTNICQTTNTGATATAYSNYTGILTDTPAYELDVAGTVAATNIKPTTITDSLSSVGTSGQILSSTGSAISWIPLMGSFTPTYSTPTLTLPFGSNIFSTGTLTFTGTTNSVTALSISGGVSGGQYTVYLYNNGSSTTTITNGSTSSSQRYTFTSITINASRYAILSIVYNSTSPAAYLISGTPYNN